MSKGALYPSHGFGLLIVSFLGFGQASESHQPIQSSGSSLA